MTRGQKLNKTLQEPFVRPPRPAEGLTLEPCLARTSHSPLVNVTSSLIAHLKSPIKTDDYSYRRTFLGQGSAAAAAVTLGVVILLRPTVAARV